MCTYGNSQSRAYTCQTKSNARTLRGTHQYSYTTSSQALPRCTSAAPSATHCRLPTPRSARPRRPHSQHNARTPNPPSTLHTQPHRRDTPPRPQPRLPPCNTTTGTAPHYACSAREPRHIADRVFNHTYASDGATLSQSGTSAGRARHGTAQRTQDARQVRSPQPPDAARPAHATSRRPCATTQGMPRYSVTHHRWALSCMVLALPARDVRSH